jgi:hypothetical protein
MLLEQNARLPRGSASGEGGRFKMKKFLKVESKVTSFNNRKFPSRR